MISLSKRLSKIASFIDKEDNVLDVGCDHALLDIYLSKKYSKKYYASDLRESALDMARSNLKKYNCDNVILKRGNGLEIIDECDVDTVVISGMGYMTIVNILKNINNITKVNKLVIESNTNPEKVRKFLIKKGFYIENEELVFDKNMYYVVTSYKRGRKKYSKLELELGLFSDSKYLDIELKKNNILLNIIPKKHVLKRLEIKRKIKYLNQKKNSISK